MKKLTLKQKAKKYRESGFLQLITTSDKEFVKRAEDTLLKNLIGELEYIKNCEQYEFTQQYDSRRKKFIYILEINER